MCDDDTIVGLKRASSYILERDTLKFFLRKEKSGTCFKFAGNYDDGNRGGIEKVASSWYLMRLIDEGFHLFLCACVDVWNFP